MIDFVCPHCDTVLQIPEEHVGQSGTCNRCGRRIAVLLTEAAKTGKRKGPVEYPYRPEQEDHPVIAAQIRHKAQEAATGFTASKRHAALTRIINDHYRDRELDAFSLAGAIQACKQQTAIAPQVKREMLARYPDSALPRHPGYELLATIRERQGRYDMALRLCEHALAEGWHGDWRERIARLKKKAIASR